MERQKVRIPLLLVGVLATVAFGPLSAFGAYVLLAGMTTQARDNLHLIGWGVIGIGGVIGLAGAWARLLVSGTQFQTRPLLKWATAASLVVGLLVAAFTFAGVLRDPADLMSWFMLPTLAAGVFLLGATIGEMRSNSAIEGDRPQATRRSL